MKSDNREYTNFEKIFNLKNSNYDNSDLDIIIRLINLKLYRLDFENKKLKDKTIMLNYILNENDKTMMMLKKEIKCLRNEVENLQQMKNI